MSHCGGMGGQHVKQPRGERGHKYGAGYERTHESKRVPITDTIPKGRSHVRILVIVLGNMPGGAESC